MKFNLTVYGMFSDDGKCWYVGSTNDMLIREKAHRKQLPMCCRRRRGFPKNWEMRPIVEMVCDLPLESKKAEGYWILRLLSEGHPIVNVTLEGWPLMARDPASGWWPYIEAWAATKGFVKLESHINYLTIPDAAERSGRSRQFLQRSAQLGGITGALLVGDYFGTNWLIPESFVLGLGPPVRDAEQARVSLAMALVKDGITAYRAAKTVGIALSSIYRSKLYKEWRDAQKNRG